MMFKRYIGMRHLKLEIKHATVNVPVLHKMVMQLTTLASAVSNVNYCHRLIAKNQP